MWADRMRASRPPHVRLLEGLVSIQNGKWNTTTLTGAVCAGTVISEPPLRSAVPEVREGVTMPWGVTMSLHRPKIDTQNTTYKKKYNNYEVLLLISLKITAARRSQCHVVQSEEEIIWRWLFEARNEEGIVESTKITWKNHRPEK